MQIYPNSCKVCPILSNSNGSVKSARLKNNITSEPAKLNKQEKLVTQAFAKVQQEADRWVSLSALGTALRQVQADFQTNNYGYPNLSALLQSMPDFVELQVNDNGNAARLKK